MASKFKALSLITAFGIIFVMSQAAQAKAPIIKEDQLAVKPVDGGFAAIDAIQDAIQDYADDHPDDAYAQALLNTYVQQVDVLVELYNLQSAAENRGNQSRADFYQNNANDLNTQLSTDPVSVLPPSLWNYGLHHHVPVDLGGPLD
jgi:hypothetical protein